MPIVSRLIYLTMSVAIMIPAASASSVQLAAHRAVYDLELGRNDSKSGYNDAHARLAYEITGSSCEGWSVNYRFAGKYEQSEGTIQITDTQMTSWEAGDGSELRVNQKNFVDNTETSENRVTVRKPKPDASAKAEITMPEQKMFDLTASTLFPILYQTRLIGVAESGKTYDQSVVYDGTDGEKVYKVISFIGKNRPGKASEVEQNPNLASLKAMPAWAMTTSYFDNSGQSDEPLYQSSYAMYENGVSADLLFDYGSYTLKGKLTKLELLKSSPCE